MTIAPLRIGFIGAGGIARQRHLPGLKAVEGIELTAVANRTRASSERTAAEWGFATVCDDWQDVLDRDDVDAVVIAAPPYLHCEATIAALDAGKHVFCQARMARDYAEARRMYERARRSDRVSMLCPPPHAMKGDYVVKRLIADGFLGTLYQVLVRGLAGTYADAAAPLHWRQDAFISGYNMLDLGMHVEVLHRWVGYFDSLSAQAAYSIPRRPKAGSVEQVAVAIPDSVGVVGTLRNGALVVLSFSGVARHAGEKRIELYGSAGSITYVVDTNRIVAARADGEQQDVSIPPNEERVWSAEADFVAAIRTGSPVSPDFEEGLRYMEVTEAIQRAACTGQRVQLPLSQ